MSRKTRTRLASADLSHALRDPIVPLDFGGWARRVVRVFGQNFRRLSALALVPIGLIGLWLIIGGLLKPDSDEIQRRLLAEIAAHPGQKVDLSTQFWILYGRTLPITVAFGILIVAAGILYQACAHFLVLRGANGQPTNVTEALQLAKPRIFPFLGQSILAALIVIGGTLTPPILGTFFLPDGTKIIGNVVAIAVVLCLITVFGATFGGVVLVERAGVQRCFRLVRPRFCATLGRMLLVATVYGIFGWLHFVVLGAASEPAGDLSAFGAVIAFTVNLILCIPLMVFQVAASVVTYAELRFHDDPTTSTRTLLADLARP